MLRKTSRLLAVVLLCGVGQAGVCLGADEPKTGQERNTLLYVRTVPPGAKVLLDGKQLGVSDSTFFVEPGVGTIRVELEGHQPGAKEVTIQANRVTRVELELKPQEAAGGGQQPRDRYFVRLVVGKDGMTFEGQTTTLGELPALLEKVPHRSQTVLEIAIASDDLTYKQTAGVIGHAGTLAHRLGFEYASEIGVHSLGSKGSPTQKVTAPVRRELTIAPGSSMTTPPSRPSPMLGFMRGVQWPRDIPSIADINYPKCEQCVRLFDAQTKGAEVLLDLATGRTAKLSEDRQEPLAFLRQNTGDLLFDRGSLGCLRGCTAKRWDYDSGQLRDLPIAGQKGDVTAYVLADATRLLITTAQKKTFDVYLYMPPDSNVIMVNYRCVDLEAANQVQAAFKAWLALIDAGKYAESWDGAAPLFKAAITREEWVNEIRAIRNAFGKPRSLQLFFPVFTKHLSGAPDGEYAVCQRAIPSDKVRACESVAMSHEKDGAWKVAVYHSNVQGKAEGGAAGELGAVPKSAQDGAPASGNQLSDKASFGPVIERVVGNDSSGGSSLINLDTGELAKPPVLNNDKDRMAWAVQHGADALGVTSAGVRGLVGFDMIVIPIDEARWDNITPAAVQSQLAFGKPGTPAVMSGKGNLPASFLFQTREGGKGVLQILSVSDDPKEVKVRYKLIKDGTPQDSNQASATGGTTPGKRVLLPNANTPGAECVLDLASGELLPLPQGGKDPSVFTTLGKGDLATSERQVVCCLRGGTIEAWWDGQQWVHLPVAAEKPDFKGYSVPSTPCRLVVVTAEKKRFEVTLLSWVTVEGRSGLNLKYRPADAEMARQVGPAPEKWVEGVRTHMRARSGRALSQLGMCLENYAQEHGGKYPDGLGEITDSERFFHKGDKAAKWIAENVTYLGKGKTTADNPQQPMAYDKNTMRTDKGTNVLFRDGHIAFVPTAELTRDMVEPISWSVGVNFFGAGDAIGITEVKATSPEPKKGDKVIVKGYYTLVSRSKAELCLFATATKGSGRSEIRLGQTTGVSKGQGQFELFETLPCDGYLHVTFYSAEGKPFGGMYFGTAKQMEEIKHWDVQKWYTEK